MPAQVGIDQVAREHAVERHARERDAEPRERDLVALLAARELRPIGARQDRPERALHRLDRELLRTAEVHVSERQIRPLRLRVALLVADRDADQIAEELTAAFDKYCSPVPA